MATTQFITHITSSGERWDLVAWKYYGNATLYSPIIMANPGIAIEPVFSAGLTLLVPMLAQSNTAPANLPPWKQVSQ